MPAAIYVHWAFCPYICPYCDFAKWAYDERAAERYVRALEAEIDRATAQLAPLRSFVLPGGSRLNAELHVCRTVCRRAERTAVTLAREGGVDELCVRYLNRLSDALFVYSRWANQLLGVPDTLWEPNRAASAR